MSLDPQLIRSEPHTEIGEILQRSVGMVIERWCRRAVEEQPNAKRVHHEVLLDHLQDFLSTLGRSLMESGDPDTYQHCLAASRHGEQRWEAGWALPEVVRDYQILRLVILDFLEENLDRPLGYREVLAIGLALDEAIAASVVMYVNRFPPENPRFLPCWQLSQIEMNPVDHRAFPQIIEKWVRTLADSLIELTATPCAP